VNNNSLGKTTAVNGHRFPPAEAPPATPKSVPLANKLRHMIGKQPLVPIVAGLCVGVMIGTLLKRR
jgi:hypothetical protein